MATRTLQPSEYDIQREVEALRDIRRRSTTPGALTIDPDLPNQSPPSSPTAYRIGSPGAVSPFHQDSTGGSLSDESSVDSGSGSGASGSSGESSSAPNNPADDPFHLFWVPASLHPEIAPAEFRAFLKEHARSPPSSESSASLGRSDSSLSSSSSLGRKRSMLSRQYSPAEHDGVENEHVVPLRRNRSSLYTNRGPQLTINDLQRLEELAEEASESDDPSRLRNVLRRSLSLNISPSAIDQMDEMPDMGDEADAPIIVPPPGQILRRAARTKIRKPGLPGDGDGHRFGSTRRGALAKTSTAPLEPRTSSDVSSSDHGDSVESSSTNRRRTFTDEGFNQRPDSFSEETSIFEAYTYARDDEEEDYTAPVVVTAPPAEEAEPPAAPPIPPEIQPALLEALGPIIHHPQPQSSSPQPLNEYQGPPSRTPSPPETSSPPPSEPPPPVQPPLAFLSTVPRPPPHQQRKDKDKKGLFGKWGGDKGGKKNAKDKERESRERVEKEKEKEKEKDSSFFGSLFGGGSKKKQDQDYPPPLGVHGGASGRETAQALLGASKSKASAPPLSPALSIGVGANSYARYPIHVERAIYRLSHIKLANPRRPLYEQVLISNLMFWYLGVINKAQNPAPSPNGQPVAGVQAPASTAAGQATETEQLEREQREKDLAEQRERLEKEQFEKERSEREQREREMEMKKKESGKRGSLTKAPAPGSPGGGRRAEMPVKGPQYEMQHRVMEQEYNGYNGQSQQGVPMGRSASSPVGGGNGQQYARAQQPQVSQFHNTLPKLAQPEPQKPDDGYIYSTDASQGQQQQSRLPPGAMPPQDQPWQQSSKPRKHSSPSPPPSPGGSHRSRSPPPNQGQPGRYNANRSQDNLISSNEGGGRLPGRSLSATAVPSPTPPHMNGKVRKGTSAHAAVPSQGKRPRTSEGRQETNGTGEEDMPLAMWQQQRRR